MIIHRHQLPRTSEPFTLPIHPDAHIIHVGPKDDGSDAWHLWEMHDETLVRPQVVPERTLRIVATGEAFTGTHVGTFTSGPFVWHVVAGDS